MSSKPHRPRGPAFFAYSRVSDTRQVQSGLSLQSQEQQAGAFYKLLTSDPQYKELLWGGLFAERAKSAYKLPFLKRPKAVELQGRLKKGDHVYFARLDRGFRNARDFLNMHYLWSMRGIVLHVGDINAATDTPYGRFTLGILALVAELESDLKSARVKAANAVKAMQGLAVIPSVPRVEHKHVKVGGKVYAVPDRRKHVVMRLVRVLRDVEKLSYQKIAARIDDAIHLREVLGLPLPREDAWKWIGFETLQDRTTTIDAGRKRYRRRPVWRFRYSHDRVLKMYRRGNKLEWNFRQKRELDPPGAPHGAS